MKNSLLTLLTIYLVVQLQAQTLYESRFGYSTDPSGTYRVLIIFAEIDYTGSCDADPYAYNPEWLVDELPAFKDELIDVESLATPVNYISKYFHEMSFGNLNLIGDYYPEIITINCADAIAGSYGGTSNVTDYLDNLTAPIVTENGYELADFDSWTITSPGLSKTNSGDGLLDAVAIIWRNNTYIDGTPYTNAPCGSGYAFQNLGTYPIQSMTDCPLLASFSACAESDAFGLIIAEYFHTLFGGNNWHSGSGAGPFTFQSPVSSFSMTAQSASMSQVACGWDRQQMGWYGWADDNFTTLKTELISALNASRSEVNTGITIENYPSGGTFILRDFIKTNDALQIKLPHLNWTSNGDVKNQYLWVENHQQISEFDHSKAADCSDWTPGMLAYIQVGKDIKESNSVSELYPNYGSLTDHQKPNGLGNWLFPLSAEGSFDDYYLYDDITNANVECLWENYSLPKDKTLAIPNPLTGYSDLFFIVSSDGDGFLDAEDIYQPGYSYYDPVLDEIIHTKYCYGDAGDVFTFAGNNKIGISTNPPSTPRIHTTNSTYLLPIIKQKF